MGQAQDTCALFPARLPTESLFRCGIAISDPPISARLYKSSPLIRRIPCQLSRAVTADMEGNTLSRSAPLAVQALDALIDVNNVGKDVSNAAVPNLDP